MASDVKGVGKEAVDGFGDHGEVGGDQQKLKGGRVHLETVLEEEVDPHPWQTPQPLYPEP